MIQESASSTKTVLSFGLIYGIVSVIFSLVIYYSGLYKVNGVSYIDVAFGGLIIYFALKYYRDNENNGLLAYGKGVSVGVLISLINGVILSVFTYIYFKFLDTNVLENMRALAQEKALEGGASQDQLDAAEGFYNMIISPFGLSISQVFSALFVGLIISLIIAAVLKKLPKQEF